jgi:hypothetical protein
VEGFWIHPVEFWPPGVVGRLPDAPFVWVPRPLSLGVLWGAAEIVHHLIVMVNMRGRTPEIIAPFVKSRPLEIGVSRGSEFWVVGVKLVWSVKIRSLVKMRGSPLVGEIRVSIEQGSIAVQTWGTFIKPGGTTFKSVSRGTIITKRSSGGNTAIIVLSQVVKIIFLSIKLILLEFNIAWSPSVGIRMRLERGSKIRGTWLKIGGTLTKIRGTWLKIGGTLSKIRGTWLKIGGTLSKIRGTWLKIGGTLSKIRGTWLKFRRAGSEIVFMEGLETAVVCFKTTIFVLITKMTLLERMLLFLFEISCRGRRFIPMLLWCRGKPSPMFPRLGISVFWGVWGEITVPPTIPPI